MIPPASDAPSLRMTSSVLQKGLPWRIALLWVGVPLCLSGMAVQGVWAQWAPGRFGELILLAGGAWLLAWPLRRMLGCSLATALLVPWGAALVLFAGVPPVAATVLLGLAAVALGSTVARGLPIAVQCACGLALGGTLLGWLLPLPVHGRWVYLAACAALIAWRWRVLASLLGVTRAQWVQRVDGSPRAAALAVMVLGLASTGCWLPTLQVDDLGYHLRLPWQLAQAGVFPMDAETHMWALSPWLGDVLHALPQLIAGTEARGPVNALWLLVTASGVWQLAGLSSDEARTRWYAVALYASLPLTPVLAASMQTEMATAALLVWLVWMIARPSAEHGHGLACAAVLAAGLLALKLAALLFVLLLLPWALWRHRTRLRLVPAVAAACAVLVLAGSSYAYAGIFAGNPILPLFNGWFQSPYAPLAHFNDLRWHAGFGLLLPWRLTLETQRYLEAFAGGAGFAMVALAGAWLLALGSRATATLAIVATTLLLVPLIPMQYLRYVFPALVVLMPLLAVATLHNHPRHGAALLIAVCVLNLAFQANGHWMLRTGALKQTVLSPGRDQVLFEKYAPERILAEAIRDSGGPAGNVLALDPAIPHSAEFGSRGRTVSSYDPSLARAAALADLDGSGNAWADLLRSEAVSDILLRPASLTQAQRAGLERAGARQRGEAREAQWWSLPAHREQP